MSYYDYTVSKEIAARGFPFYALIMAAMRQADTDNSEKLAAAWPNVWRELVLRYNAPYGVLPGETTNDDEEGGFDVR